MEDRNEDWCWAIDEESEIHGPFPSREAAVQNASDLKMRRCLDARRIMVGRMGALFPEQFAKEAADCGELLDRFCDSAAYDCFGDGEEPVFSFAVDQAEAQKMLDSLIAQWAASCIKADREGILDPEMVELP